MIEHFYQLEEQCAAQGILMAGADEAGRGPLAGPVVAAACILSPDSPILGINDSKKLSEKKREALYPQIVEQALAYAVGVVDVETIETINILNAARKAFQMAVKGLSIQPDHVYADQITGLELPMPYTPIIKGDAKVYSIAAASVLAKVTRDRIMREYDAQYPGYGFAQNKGYGTKAHQQAILELGPTPIHRMSFLGNLLKNGAKS